MSCHWRKQKKIRKYLNNDDGLDVVQRPKFIGVQNVEIQVEKIDRLHDIHSKDLIRRILGTWNFDRWKNTKIWFKKYEFVKNRLTFNYQHKRVDNVKILERKYI